MDEKELKDAKNILLYGICDTMNILVDARNIGAVSTDENTADVY